MPLVEYSSYFCKFGQIKEGGGDNQNLPKTSIEESLYDVKSWIALMSATDKKVERQQARTLIHLMFHREVLLLK
jgi:hypothetical protein